MMSWYRPDLRLPVRFTLASLVFLYVLQYPLARLLTIAVEGSHPIEDWIEAVVFVAVSSIWLLVALILGASGPAVPLQSPTPASLKPGGRPPRPLSVARVFAVFTLLFGWSLLMLRLKIGMTMYTDFDPLPFRLTGVLFYGRLFVQPLLVAYIAHATSGSRLRPLVFALVVLLGVWTSLTSGSHFISIMFALPLLLLFTGLWRWTAFVLAVSANFVIASLTRHFFLPFVIGGDYPLRYASPEYQEIMLSGLAFLPVGYLVVRTMGLGEVVLTLKHGSITHSFADALQALFAFYLPFVPAPSASSIKNVYGLNDDFFGGFGLGLFPNYWVLLGGNWITYLVGLGLGGWLLGVGYRQGAIALRRAGFTAGIPLVFVFLFIIFFEARAYLLPGCALLLYLMGRPFIQALVGRIWVLASGELLRLASARHSRGTRITPTGSKGVYEADA